MTSPSTPRRPAAVHTCRWSAGASRTATTTASCCATCRAASVVANLVRTVGNTQTIVATTTVPGLTVSPGDQLRARFLVGGTTDTTLQAKVWRKGTAEPAAWLLTNTSATPAVLQAPGDVGLMLFVSSSWTGATPTLRADNLNAGPDSGPPANVKPTASFTSTHEFLHAAFDASASNDFDGTITSYAWDFGDPDDPTPGTGVTPTHDYHAAPAPTRCSSP